MKRRDFVTCAGATLCQAVLTPGLLAQAAHGKATATTPDSQPVPAGTGRPVGKPMGPADITLRIAPVALEIAPSHFISTIGYNGTSPGPVLRMREGKTVTVDVINDSDATEFVHWHGLLVPAAVDGAEEEGTPSVPAGGRRRYQFTPKPAGTRWYHSHAMAMGDLHRGSYTGQYGFVVIDSGTDAGRYDQEIFLALRDWEPFYTDQYVDMDEVGTPPGPQPEKPTRLDTRANGLEPISQVYSINDKALGAGEPIRVRQGTRVLVHLLNASALENRTLALPGHEFHVLALDGNPVPAPGPAKVITLGPGERVDAYIEMNRPGVWILGATDDMIRNAGLGVVVEYANQHREPQWGAQPGVFWDYTKFGAPVSPQGATSGTASKASPRVIDMVFEKVPGGAHPFNSWTINGKSYPHEREFVLQEGQRYRINFRNRTDDSHPVHLHRHLFELIDVNGKATRGIMKDTVVVPLYGRVSVDLVADQPGLSLFHCHIQAHMDYGFKALFRYG
jgi:FtsP/CotA-like multicopper oxidase with cupredoxin domain